MSKSFRAQTRPMHATEATPTSGHLKMERKSVAELIPADYNPRSISEKAKAGLKASIEAFGVVQPIVWNAKTGNVVSGHQRLKVMMEKGITETDVVVVELEDVQEKALNVTMNNHAIEGDFDQEMLDDLLLEIGNEIPELLKDVQLDALLPKIDEDVGTADDLSDSIQMGNKLEVSCDSDGELEALYNELTERGMFCRILTL